MPSRIFGKAIRRLHGFRTPDSVRCPPVPGARGPGSGVQENGRHFARPWPGLLREAWTVVSLRDCLGRQLRRAGRVAEIFSKFGDVLSICVTKRDAPPPLYDLLIPFEVEQPFVMQPP